MACAAGMATPLGRAALAPADEADLKTRALRGARAEVQRAGAGGDALRAGVYLDTALGPTPAEYLYENSHRPEWLEAMVATKLVDALFGPATERQGALRMAVTIEVGAPWPAGRDTFAILYDWCYRRVPTRYGNVHGPAHAWRDSFVRSDTGWTLVAHAPVVTPTGCTR